MSPTSYGSQGNSLDMSKQLSQHTKMQQMDQYGNNVIMEEDGEQADDHSEQEQLDKEIQEFLMISKVQMQRAGQITNGLNIPKKVDTSKPNGNGQNGYKSITTQN